MEEYNSKNIKVVISKKGIFIEIEGEEKDDTFHPCKKSVEFFAFDSIYKIFLEKTGIDRLDYNIHFKLFDHRKEFVIKCQSNLRYLIKNRSAIGEPKLFFMDITNEWTDSKKM